MSYLALYRKWRPLLFEEIIDQEHIAKTLRNSVTSGRISHAYLFTGPRGTGKTSAAHILSRAINCLNPSNGNPCNKCSICLGIQDGSILDVLEIDAASNNSVDNVREIRDEVVYIPSQAKYKVYIIDEVHMLSSGAFNALLKTLEEPPERVVFILATTEPQKVPQTIISRCQRHDFHKISSEGITRQLEQIAAGSAMILDKEAMRLIARLSEGSMRDAIGLLDQCISIKSCDRTETGSAAAARTGAGIEAEIGAEAGELAYMMEISYNDVLSLVGTVNEDIIHGLVEAIITGDAAAAITQLGAILDEGKDIARFISDLIWYYRNMLICTSTGTPDERLTGAPAPVAAYMQEQGAELGSAELILSIKELSNLESNLKWSSNPKVMLEVVLIKLCGRLYSFENESLLEKVAALEKRIEDISSSGASYIQKPAPQLQPDQLQLDQMRQNQPQSDYQHQDQPQHAAPLPKPDQKPNQASGTQIDQQSKTVAPRELLFWDEILHDLRNSGKMLIFANLEDTCAYELDGSDIGIVFKPGSSLHKVLIMKPGNSAVIEECLQKKMGRAVRIKCIDETNCPPGMKKRQASPKAAGAASPSSLAGRLPPRRVTLPEDAKPEVQPDQDQSGQGQELSRPRQGRSGQNKSDASEEKEAEIEQEEDEDGGFYRRR